jgi:hypothetical protein
MQLFLDDHESLGHDPWLAEARSITLDNTVVHAEDGSHYLHQGIVTLLAIEAQVKQLDEPVRFEKHTWGWLGDQQWANHISKSCRDERGEFLHSILFLHWITDEPKNPTLDAVYRAARTLKHTMGSYGSEFRTYPSESEATQERGKLGDIRALGQVAQASPASYRPKTCFGHGPCVLHEDQTVHKRTHSGCAMHVHLRKREERHQLTCTLKMAATEPPSRQGGRPSKRKQPEASNPQEPAYSATSDDSAYWFHQEFVPTLQKRVPRFHRY